jgi:PAS domain S-box-containing protein
VPSKVIFFITLIVAIVLFILVLQTMRKVVNKQRSNDANSKTSEIAGLQHAKIADVTDVIERVSDAFVALDTNWCYTYMNQKAGEIFNRDTKAIVGKNIWEEFPEGVGQPFYKAYYKAMEEQQYVYMEEYYAPYDLWFENHIYPSPTGLTIYFRDVTKSKKAQQALQENEEHLQKILDQSLDVICTANRDGIFINTSAACNRLWGYTREELIGKPFFEFVFEEDREKTIAVTRDIISGKEITNFENCYKHKNGTLVSMHWVARWDEGSQLIYAIARDITKRKLAEQLSIKEKFLSDSVINSLPGVFYLYDQTGKFIRWNKNFETVSGYSGDEISNMHPLDFFIGEEKKLLAERIKDVFEEGESDVEACFITKDGREVPYYFTGLSINYEDKLCLIGAGIDITKRKTVEMELKASNEQLRSLSSHLQNIREEERIRIAREIHDELGQQLTGLKMDVYWLNKKLEKKDEAIQEKISGIIELIDETVKSVRRISSNLRPSILDDLGLVAALEWHSREVEKRSEIKVHFVTTLSEQAIAVDVATGIFRIYQEALTNAVRHANAHEINSSLQLIDSQLVLKIKDDGKGIDHKAKATTKTLGLIGIKERTFVLGGKYELKSGPGEGTELCISIPIPNLPTS